MGIKLDFSIFTHQSLPSSILNKTIRHELLVSFLVEYLSEFRRQNNLLLFYNSFLSYIFSFDYSITYFLSNEFFNDSELMQN